MEQINRCLLLANRLREVFLSGHWIAGTNYKEQLQALSWQQATKQVLSFNTVAALTYHIDYYLAGLLAAFETGKLEISDRFSFDLPPIRSEADWQWLLAALLQHAAQFATLVEQMDEATLDQPFIDARYGTVLRNIEGVIEHSYYHLGQITIVGKAMRQQAD